ncbi:MAG: hypothetical protein GX630_09720 [Actinobacteria bacterium]|nr:hypothetical protein [Actinomycetota bacterium]
MKRFLQVSALALCAGLLLSAPALATSPDNSASGLVSRAHVYSVKPGEPAWNALHDHDQKAAACHVASDELSRMTTDAVVQTVLDYPLLVDVFAYDTLEEGIERVSAQFAGLSELRSRADAAKVLGNLKDKSSAGNQRYRNLCISVLKDYVSQSSPVERQVSLVAPAYTTSHVLTPKLSWVSTLYRLPWSAHYYQGTTMTYQLALAVSQAARSVYPSATIVGNPSSTYNCHSYAWYSTSSSNPHWMNSPSAYMSDGSYRSSSCQVGARVWYGMGGHSAIVAQTGFRPRVTSKWGCLAVFSHYYNDCPYGSNVTYWVR